MTFLARVTGSLPSTYTVIIFKTVEVNQGGGYNSNTGNFTAPVAGSYLFSAQLCTTDGHVYFNLMVNGKVFGALYHGTINHGVCSSMSSTAVLEAGDTVWVRNYGSTTTVLEDSVNYWNMFSGVLVQPKYT